jgi:hypothetical protein
MPPKPELVPYPLAGYKTVILPREGIGVILEIATVQDGKDNGERVVVFAAMKRDQARALGQSLLKLANTPDVRDPKGQA